MKFMSSKRMRGFLTCFFLFCMGHQAPAAAALTAQSAFKLAFEQTPPMARTVKYSGARLDYRLTPLLLVRLSSTRVALIIAENHDGGNDAAGTAAVAYLNWQSGEWRLVRVWYEFIEAGSFGTAFINYRALHFGETPMFAGESMNSGAGSVTTWYNVIGLYPDGPVAWGFIHASGAFNTDFPSGDSDGSIGCGGYNYSSVISAPRQKGDLMRVTYKGWMRSGADKRRDFLLSTEISLRQAKLNMQPAIKVPNCGQ
jgi:hypothetical protein